MANRPPNPGTDDDSGVRPTADRPPGTPRWVKVFGLIAIVVVLLIAIMLLTGHGPGRHTPSGDAGGQVRAFSAMEEHASLEGGRG